MKITFAILAALAANWALILAGAQDLPAVNSKGPTLNPNGDTYAGWAAEVAAAEKAPFIDLNETIAGQYDSLGAEKVEPLFGDEHTHTSRAGAELNAATVIAGLKALPQNPLAPYFGEKAKDVPSIP